MKVFVANFNGVWLGGVAVVLAENQQEAANILSAKLQAEYSDGVPLVGVHWTEAEVAAGVVYFDDGDY